MSDWAYGVITTKTRLSTALPRTLVSLHGAGFTKPRLFVDGWQNPNGLLAFDLPVTVHDTPLGIVGNWITSLWELYARNPRAKWYAIFQDDILACSNLRSYLDQAQTPMLSYRNLYTHRENEQLSKQVIGWHLSNQRGMGALGLVFDRDTVQLLLSSKLLVEKPTFAQKPDYAIDGAVFQALKLHGYKEYTHYPSLLQHQQCVSTLKHNYGGVRCFPGEDYDATLMLENKPINPIPPKVREPQVSHTPRANIEWAVELAGGSMQQVQEWLDVACCHERTRRTNALNSWAIRLHYGKVENALQHLNAIIGAD